MKELSLKNKILSAVAALLCLAVLGLAASTIVVIAVGLNPPVKEQIEKEYDFSFTGKISLYDVDYDVSLNAENGSFSVKAGRIEDVVSGTYKFTAGQGYTFSFADATNTVVRTKFDEGNKQFSFVYHLDMGSRGVGNLLFSLEKSDFSVEGEAWVDIPSFKGTAAWFGGYVTTEVTIACDADNNFKVVDSANYLSPISGTYAYINGKYEFTTTDGAIYVAEKNADGLYAFTLNVYNPQLEAYGMAAATADVVQYILTVD